MSKALTESSARVDVHVDEDDGRRALYHATVRSLQAEVKQLPTVWLYDEAGSQLYEQITQLPEYYLPRREGEILRARAGAIAGRTQARTVVELGAGTAKNTRLLLGALDSAGTLERFVPLDVSEQPCERARRRSRPPTPASLSTRSSATSSGTLVRFRAPGGG